MSRHTNSHIYCPQQIRATSACFGLTQGDLESEHRTPFLSSLSFLFFSFLFCNLLASDVRMRSDRYHEIFVQKIPIFLIYCYIVDCCGAQKILPRRSLLLGTVKIRPRKACNYPNLRSFGWVSYDKVGGLYSGKVGIRSEARASDLRSYPGLWWKRIKLHLYEGTKVSTLRGPAQLADLQGALCVPHL